MINLGIRLLTTGKELFMRSMMRTGPGTRAAWIMPKRSTERRNIGEEED
jgi:hypothetical protein